MTRSACIITPGASLYIRLNQQSFARRVESESCAEASRNGGGQADQKL